jgi:hypothetical protein
MSAVLMLFLSVFSHLIITILRSNGLKYLHVSYTFIVSLNLIILTINISICNIIPGLSIIFLCIVTS